MNPDERFIPIKYSKEYSVSRVLVYFADVFPRSLEKRPKSLFITACSLFLLIPVR